MKKKDNMIEAEGITVTCSSLDCPERTGGKCNAVEPEVSDWEKELDRQLADFPIPLPKFTEGLKDFIKKNFIPKKELAEAIWKMKKYKQQKLIKNKWADTGMLLVSLDDLLEKLK